MCLSWQNVYKNMLKDLKTQFPLKWVFYFSKKKEIKFFSPVTITVSVSLMGEENIRPENVLLYWHWYNPVWPKFTLEMSKVAVPSANLDWLLMFLALFWKKKIPSESSDDVEHLILSSWPQGTSPAKSMEMDGFRRLSEEHLGKANLNIDYCDFQ